MNRNRASAKKAGTAFETLVAGFLAERLGDDRIERRTKNGAKDRGDIAGVRHNPALHPPPPRRRSGCSEGSERRLRKLCVCYFDTPQRIDTTLRIG